MMGGVSLLHDGEAKNVDQLRKKLLKKDRSYRILEPSECTSTWSPSTFSVIVFN